MTNLEIVSLIGSNHDAIMNAFRQAKVEAEGEPWWKRYVVLLADDGDAFVWVEMEGYYPHYPEGTVARFEVPCKFSEDACEAEIENEVNWFLKVYEA